MKLSVLFIALLALGAANNSAAEELSDIKNYLEYSDTFSSAGQPTEEQLNLASEKGFDLVVYIAFSDSRGAIDHEDGIVKKLGMDFVQIPVDWEKPTVADFQAFAGVMQINPDAKTLLHCQANYRASAFAYLYRILYQGVDAQTARADMEGIWTPDETWSAFIQEVRSAH
jgi:protein tyrosine phosphatase (PTP) superfamily phosphohydrolase (DUF442 family)